MKTDDTPRRLREGVKLVLEQEAPSSRTGSSRSSRKASTSSSRSSCSLPRSRSSSSQSSSSDSGSSSTNSRSRSRPRCSGRSHCRHSHRSPPRRYRARSHSYSRSRSPYRYSRRSPSPYRYSRRSRRSPINARSRSRSPVQWKGSRFVGRHRSHFSRSPLRPRFYRSPERSSIHLSQEEKKYLLDVAKANAARILGVQNLELPASLMEIEPKEESGSRRYSSDKKERVRLEAPPQKTSVQVNDDDSDDGENKTPQMSPKRKVISFSTNNVIARPSNSPVQQLCKVTSQADIVVDGKPYGQWLPIRKASSVRKR